MMNEGTKKKEEEKNRHQTQTRKYEIIFVICLGRFCSIQWTTTTMRRPQRRKKQNKKPEIVLQLEAVATIFSLGK